MIVLFIELKKDGTWTYSSSGPQTLRVGSTDEDPLCLRPLLEKRVASLESKVAALEALWKAHALVHGSTGLTPG